MLRVPEAIHSDWPMEVSMPTGALLRHGLPEKTLGRAQAVLCYLRIFTAAIAQ